MCVCGGVVSGLRPVPESACVQDVNFNKVLFTHEKKAHENSLLQDAGEESTFRSIPVASFCSTLHAMSRSTTAVADRGSRFRGARSVLSVTDKLSFNCPSIFDSADTISSDLPFCRCDVLGLTPRTWVRPEISPVRFSIDTQTGYFCFIGNSALR